MNIKHDKENVLKTGLSLFCNKGYNSLGIDEICKVTGMTKGAFYNAFKSKEQFLIEDLVIESIRIYGHEVFYLPRTRIAYDSVYGEDVLSEFRSSYIIEMFIKNIDGFDGDGDFISKFGLEIRDRVTFSIARRTFNNEIGSNTNAVRPNEGDLIFLPLNKKIFEIINKK